jgi:DNA-directed RNA polymerase alpha subunit
MSSKTKIDFKLSKKGPCTVYSGDLEGPADVIYEKIPITILGENHKLELVATAALGIGTEHAKHIPGLCYYRHILEVKSSLQAENMLARIIRLNILNVNFVFITSIVYRLE